MPGPLRDGLWSEGDFHAGTYADDSPVGEELMRRVRHKKRGTTYEVLGLAEVQISTSYGEPLSSRRLNEGDRLVVYQGEDGKLWARFPDEFEDGRFEPVE